MNNFHHGILSVILNMSIFVVFLWGFKIPAEKSSKVFQYWFVAFPLAFILILFGFVFSLEQIEGFEEIDPLFKIGLGVAVLTALGSLMVMVISEKRLSRLEKEVFGNKEKEKEREKSKSNS